MTESSTEFRLAPAATGRCWGAFIAAAAIVLVAAVSFYWRAGGEDPRPKQPPSKFWMAPLERRPMHADESVQAYKLGQLLETGTYAYDPAEYHGPALPYFTWPIAKLRGHRDFASLTETDLRLVPVLFGAGAILMIVLLGGGLGWGAALASALLVALSPAAVYYSRYYIHETLLVFFTVAAIATGWRYLRRPGFGWAIAFGAAVGGMHATKETWVIAAAAAAGGLAVNWAWTRWIDRTPAADADAPRWRWAHGGVMLVAALAVVIPLYSAFFTHARGPLDSVRTFLLYFDRGAGRGGDAGMHVHPWDYYLKLLLWNRTPRVPPWTESLTAGLALCGTVIAFARPRLLAGHAGLARFLGVFTWGTLLAYSLLPYKTPWLVLTPLTGMALLAGVGAAALVRLLPSWRRRSLPLALLGIGLKGLAIALLGSGMLNLAEQAQRAGSRAFYVSSYNPFVYAHTGADVLNLRDRVDQMAAFDPAGRAMRIDVITTYRWPLPWYLRQYTQVGWWDELPPQLESPIIISAAEHNQQLAARLGERYHVQPIGFRPNVFLTMWIRKDLWDRFIETVR